MHGLQGIPYNSFYRHNTNVVSNSQDSRAANVVGGGTRKRRQRRQRRLRRKTQTKTRNGGKRNKSNKSNSKKTNKRYVNYAGRQIGHQSQNQSGGMSFLPGDANLFTSSVGHMLENGVATLRGVEPGQNPLPFSDKINTHHQNL